MSDFEAVMWDFGGVFSASPFSAVEELARERQIDAAAFNEAIFGAYDRDGDHPWHQLERGEIDFGTARERIMAAAQERGFEADPMELFAHMGRGGGMREDVVEVAIRVKQAGHRTAIVTNNAKEFREHWTASVPLAEICHEVIDSSEVGIRKPDARIYQHALEKLGGVAPARSLFVDDYPANIAAAEALGIRGVLMQDDYGPALREVERLLALGAS